MSRRVTRGWWLVLLVMVALGLWRLRFDAEVLNLLPEEVPVVRGLKLYQESFANSQELLITVRAADADAAEAAARQLAEDLRPLTNLVAAAVWQPPWLDHPEDLTELVSWLWLNQPPDALGRLADSLGPQKLPGVLASAREQLATSLSPLELGRLAYDPFGLTRLPGTGLGADLLLGQNEDWFSAADGQFRVVFVEPRTPLAGYRRAVSWLQEIRARVAHGQSSPDWPAHVTVRYTGGPPFLAETATTMESDLRGSALGTLVVIALLFSWAHRRLLPLLWLMALLLVVVAGTVAAGGLILGSINLVSLGFAAILMGLGVDYGLVLYQESLAAPAASAADLRRVLAPSILWSASTTAAAFGLLYFGGLPGLSQLGLLVAIGVLLAAVTMLFGFLPVAGVRPRPAPTPDSRPETGRGESAWVGGSEPPARRAAGGPARWRDSTWLGLVVSGFVLTAALVVLGRGWPRIDHSTRSLELTGSEAQGALDELQRELNREGAPFMLVFKGRDEGEIAIKLEAANAVLGRALASQQLRGFMLPTAMWPKPERQPTNRVVIRQIALHPERLQAAATEAGFTSNACLFSVAVLQHWERMAGATNVAWPTNASCQWLLKRFSARRGDEWLAAGVLYPADLGPAPKSVRDWADATPGVWLTGWPLVGEALLAQVEHRLTWLVAAMIGILAGCLWLAFRRWEEVLLSFAALVSSFLILLAVMHLAGWSWNLMNLVAVPLLLGVGVDYTIHVQLALRRQAGDAAAMRRVTGRALLLCAGTTVAGFGSLAWASNAGLASLGLVCSTGILCAYLVSVFLLPAWWQLCRRARATDASPLEDQGAAAPAAGSGRRVTSSVLYRAGFWRAGLALVRVLPARLVDGVCVSLADVYFHLHRQRSQAVVANLLPVLSGDRSAAAHTARRLYRNFALKLVDLLRLENGQVGCRWVTDPADREPIEVVRARGRGVLFLTPHLGNWEHGGLLLADFGIPLTVLTLGEPQDELTALRAASRARWGMQTLVIGQDSFALVEVVRRLGAGAAMAIAIDRPAERNGVFVDWFGHPFRASAVAAELARASGCALVGVTFLRRNDQLVARVLPEFAYDRQRLGGRDGRAELTRQILRAFEPQIREHLDQWYHFVPIWPRPGAA